MNQIPLHQQCRQKVSQLHVWFLSFLILHTLGPYLLLLGQKSLTFSLKTFACRMYLSQSSSFVFSVLHSLCTCFPGGIRTYMSVRSDFSLKTENTWLFWDSICMGVDLSHRAPLFYRSQVAPRASMNSFECVQIFTKLTFPYWWGIKDVVHLCDVHIT